MFSVIILAAGRGKRTNLSYNKMLYLLNNETILEKSIKPFKNNQQINELIVVINESEEVTIKSILNDIPIKFVYGGKERFESVYNGLNEVTNEYVLIHDGARCFLTSELVDSLITTTLKNDAAFLAVKSKDTIHIIEEDNIYTPNRDNTFIAQTPQGFKTELIKKAYHLLMKDANSNATDDVMILKKYLNINSSIVESSYENIKITTPEDLK